ncbi:MAG: translation initiation factor IF-3 [Thermoguttaceae bacterium]|nr:translation initiation factor IF-3 [Thermoguttaceae bacterium]
MSQGRPSYPRKDSSPKQRINEQIRISEVLVIDEKGVSRGVMPTKEALKLADSVQLDLVEVAPNAKPPVCRILDYGKYKYEQNKKAKSPQSNQIKTKEIRLSPNIGAHDMMVRVNQAKGFINDKCKVQVTMSFSGRQIIYVDDGEKKMQELVEQLKDIARVDSPPKRLGRKILCILAPLSMPKSSSSDKQSDASSEQGAAASRQADGAPRPPRPMGDKPRPPRPAGDKPRRPGGAPHPNNGGNGGSSSRRPQ